MEKDSIATDNTKDIISTSLDTNSDTKSEPEIEHQKQPEKQPKQEKQQNKNKLNETRNPSSSYIIWLIYIPIIGLFTYLIRQTTDIFHIISMIIALFFTIYTIHTNFFKPYKSVEDDINSDNLIEG